MSTYYKDTLSGAPIYRIAAARVTYEKADGSIGELNLAGGGGGGGAGTWADVEAFTDFPASMAYGDTIEEARNAIGAASVDDIPTWSTLSGKPAVVAAGADAAAARTAIGAANTGANANITSLTGLTTALSVPQGGTGVTTLNDLATALNISGFMPGLAPSISNVDTWTIGGLRSMTTTTVGRPTGTVNGDMIMNFVSATNAAQLAFLMTAGKLVFRVFTTSWQPWQDVTKTALA